MRGKLVVVVAGAACGIAAAQPATDTLTATLAATPARPGGVEVSVRLDVKVPAGARRPVFTGIELWTGPGVTVGGRRFPSCATATLRRGGPAACPRRSLMGTGALLGDPALGMDFAQRGRITIVNGPSGVPSLWIVSQDPARVADAAVGTLVRSASTRWPGHVRWTIPRSLQVAAGVPITPFGLSFVLGGAAWAKDYISTAGCRDGGWAWKLRVHTGDGQGGAAGVLDAHGRVPCG
ncbi:MAG TPA: hypothetical protein VI318_24015 [Baekduia sp.]